MAGTTIDSLVVRLGLDSTEFTRGSRRMSQDLDETRRVTERTARDISENGRRAAEFFIRLERAALKFFAVITVGRGLSDFTRTIIQTGAQLDRMAGYLGTSADRLSRWQGAVRQSGGTAEGLMGTMQGLSSALTELRLTGTTGILPYLQSLGVSLADANGKAKPLEQILLDISDTVKKKIPKGDQFNFMRMLGIDDGTANLLLKNRGEIERLLSVQKSYSDADAKAAREGQEKWEGIKLNIERTTQELVIRLIPTLEKVARIFERLAINSVPVLIDLGRKFEDLDRATDGWSTALLACLATLRIIGGAGIVSGIAKLAGALGAAASATLLLKGDESESTAAAKALQKKAMEGDREAAEELAKIQIGNQWWRRLTKEEPTEQEIQDRADQIQGGYKTIPPTNVGGPRRIDNPASINKSRAERNNNPGNLEYYGQLGSVREDGEGRFAKFGTMEQGVAALARQLQLYSYRGIDTIEKIISTYAPSSENNTAAYIDAIVKRLGIGANEKLNLDDASTLSGLIQGISRHEAGRSFLSDQQVMTGLTMAGVSGATQQGSSVSIGEVKVYTQATDANGIARDIRGAMIRQADTGVQ